MSHAINWFEIPVADLDRAMTFYATVTGRKLQRMDFGMPGMEEAVFATDQPDERTGSLVKGEGFQPGVQGGAMLYLSIGDSLDASLKRVQTAGGTVARERPICLQAWVASPISWIARAIAWGFTR